MRWYRTASLIVAALAGALFATPVAAHPPYGIVADAQGNVYFSDLERVWRLAPDGSVSLFRPTNGAHVHEMALAANGDVIGDEGHYDPATETFSSAIWARSPAGHEHYVLPRTSSPPRGRGLQLDRHGNSYTAQWPSLEDRRTMLLRRARDGQVDLLFGDRAAAARFRQAVISSVGGMAFDATGALWFADGRFLRRADPSGAVTTRFEGDNATHLRGVSVGSDARIYAADIGRRRLLAFPAVGEPATVYRSAPGWAPSGVTASTGRIFVLEAEQDPLHLSNRVRVVEVRNGEAAVVATPDPRAARRDGAPSGSSPGRDPSRLVVAIAAAALSVVAAFAWRKLRKRA
jgi:streptogramin lyase